MTTDLGRLLAPADLIPARQLVPADRLVPARPLVAADPPLPAVPIFPAGQLVPAFPLPRGAPVGEAPRSLPEACEVSGRMSSRERDRPWTPTAHSAPIRTHPSVITRV